jgi:hypothetical protein
VAWTGVIALLLNGLFFSRFLTLAGMAWALAILPLTLLLGSVGMALVPGLLLVTAVRGAAQCEVA